MIVAVLVGVFDGVPDGQRVGMQHDVCLTSEGRIPQESVTLAIHTGRTTDDMLLVFGDKKPTGIGLRRLNEELVVRNISFRLEPVVLT